MGDEYFENIDSYDIVREGNVIHIIFRDIVENGNVFTFPVDDAIKIGLSIVESASN